MKKRQKQNLDAEAENERRTELRRRINQSQEKLGQAPVEERPATRPAEVGDTVELARIGTRATVTAVNKDGTLQLKAGILNISAKQEEVRVVSGAQKKTQKSPMAPRGRNTNRNTTQHQVTRGNASMEVDLRGMMVDEALMAVDAFLDSAVMSHLNTVTIIHGKGTGALRTAVQTHLRKSKYVKTFRLGRYGEGENGVTVVELK